MNLREIKHFQLIRMLKRAIINPSRGDFEGRMNVQDPAVERIKYNNGRVGGTLGIL